MGERTGGTFLIVNPILLSLTGAATSDHPPGYQGPFNCGVSGNHVSGGYTISPLPGYTKLQTSAHGTVDLDGAPPGFTPTTNIRAAILSNVYFADPGDTVTVTYGDQTITYTGPQPGQPGGVPALHFPDGTLWSLLKTASLIVNGSLIGAPLTAGSNFNSNNACTIAGNYIIAIYWWQLPAKTACGEDTGATHLVYASSPPTGDYVKLSTAPTPVITSLEPNHGFAGTAVTIKGSGFGDGATVTFDGVAATSVVVVSQYEITCNAPGPHAPGGSSVIVTNVDGGHSSAP